MRNLVIAEYSVVILILISLGVLAYARVMKPYYDDGKRYKKP